MADYRGLFIAGGITLVWVWILYEVIRSPFRNPMFLIVNIVVSFYIWLQIWGWMSSVPLKKGANFFTASGVVGTKVGGPITRFGGKVTYKVATFKQYIPKALYQNRSWGEVFVDMLTGTKTIEVTNDADLFHELPMDQLEASEGAIFYDGRLDLGPIKYGFTDVVKQKVLEQANLIRSLITEKERTIRELQNLSRQSTYDQAEIVSKLKDTIRGLQQPGFVLAPGMQSATVPNQRQQGGEEE